jgi:hypothetical protein
MYEVETVSDIFMQRSLCLSTARLDGSDEMSRADDLWWVTARHLVVEEAGCLGYSIPFDVAWLVNKVETTTAVQPRFRPSRLVV